MVERHGAVMAHADGDPFGVEEAADILGVDAIQIEADDSGLFLWRGAVDLEVADCIQCTVKFDRQFALVGGDLGHADFVEVVNRGGETSGFGDGGRSRFEFGGELARREAIERDLIDHAAAAEEGGHLGEEFFFAIEHTDAGGAEDLVPAEGDEIGIPLLDINLFMGRGLGGVDERDGAGGMRGGDDFFDGEDCSQHITDGGERDEFCFAAEFLLKVLPVEFTFGSDANPLDECASAGGGLLPGDDIGMVLGEEEQDFIACLEVGVAPASCDEVDRHRRAGGEDDFVGLRGAEKGLHFGAGVFVGFGGAVA